MLGSSPATVVVTDDMVEGYKDGGDPNSPEPSANRSASYRHGFANGRDDLRRDPRASASVLRREAAEALEKDKNPWQV